MSVTRRELAKVAAGLGVGLTLGLVPRGLSATVSGVGEFAPFEPSIWLNVGASGICTISLAKSEIGQGVETALPMLVAEELCCAWEDVRVINAPIIPGFGNRYTGSSRSVLESWLPLREAGAAARQMLVTAASAVWGVPHANCHAEAGTVIHAASGRSVGFGELVDIASGLDVPERITLKSKRQFTLIGQPVGRLDCPAKVTGELVYAIDVHLPGLLTASIAHCPVFGGKLRRLDDRAARALDGVRAVVPLADSVAVVAEDYWTASEGLRALEVEWDYGPDKAIDTESIQRRMLKEIEVPGKVARQQGRALQILKSASRQLAADYQLPFQAHAAMEPVSCTAWVKDDVCELWVPTQNPFVAEAVVANHVIGELRYEFERAVRKVFGRPLSSIKIHLTNAGGSFGRRLKSDFVEEVVQIASMLNAPVKLIWSREEDMQHDFYHPASHHRLRAAIDDEGYPVAWHHRSVGPGIKANGAMELPYLIPHLNIESRRFQVPIPTGPWRSVHNHYNAFAVESFVDEIAAVERHDPLEFRLNMLRGSPRHRAVLERVAEASDWGKALAPGHCQGVALDAGFGSYIAQVVELSVSQEKRLRIHKVTSAVDCGIVVNPNIASAQIEGAVVFGLTAALKGAITIGNGRVEQSNFFDYPLLRFDEMPNVRTIFVDNDRPPGGVGEIGVPPVAPAVGNALFRATGQRLRSLPFRMEGGDSA